MDDMISGIEYQNELQMLALVNIELLKTSSTKQSFGAIQNIEAENLSI